MFFIWWSGQLIVQVCEERKLHLPSEVATDFRWEITMASTPLFLLLFDCSCHILPQEQHAQV